VTTIFGGYVTSAPGGAMFGATHDRDEVSLEPRGEDHHRNLAALTSVLPALAGRIAVRTLEAWVGVRATTSDYLPLAGPAPDAPAGLFVLSGLGSRGFTLAPLLAEHVAATALGRPSPVPADVAALIDPGRFAARDRRRGRPAVK
jgi:tRNA 5-methylaminomethyl-2-thiouridine biosynthesis bifunctional protein